MLSQGNAWMHSKVQNRENEQHNDNEHARTCNAFVARGHLRVALCAVMRNTPELVLAHALNA